MRASKIRSVIMWRMPSSSSAVVNVPAHGPTASPCRFSTRMIEKASSRMSRGSTSTGGRGTDPALGIVYLRKIRLVARTHLGFRNMESECLMCRHCPTLARVSSAARRAAGAGQLCAFAKKLQSALAMLSIDFWVEKIKVKHRQCHAHRAFQ